jgi:hypothetical protein
MKTESDRQETRNNSKGESEIRMGQIEIFVIGWAFALGTNQFDRLLKDDRYQFRKNTLNKLPAHFIVIRSFIHCQNLLPDDCVLKCRTFFISTCFSWSDHRRMFFPLRMSESQLCQKQEQFQIFALSGEICNSFFEFPVRQTIWIARLRNHYIADFRWKQTKMEWRLIFRSPFLPKSVSFFVCNSRVENAFVTPHIRKMLSLLSIIDSRLIAFLPISMDVRETNPVWFAVRWFGKPEMSLELLGGDLATMLKETCHWKFQ